jgi:hypothetical protein
MTIIALVLLASCTKATAPVTPLSEHVKASWYRYSTSFFFTNKRENVEDFAKSLLNALAQPANSPNSVNNTFVVANILSREPDEDSPSAAQLALQSSLQEQFLAHQFASFGQIYLSKADTAVKDNSLEMQEFVASLKALDEYIAVFRHGEIDIYEANNDSSLFAYKRTKGNTRAFIAFNFSFDTQELPLPFGFMTSTKVSMWQSDAPELRTFVTSQALSIRPFTAVILIVG